MPGGGDGLYVLAVAPFLAGHAVHKIAVAIGDLHGSRGNKNQPVGPAAELDRRLAVLQRQRIDRAGRSRVADLSTPDKPGFEIVLGALELGFAAGAVALAVHFGMRS